MMSPREGAGGLSNTMTGDRLRCDFRACEQPADGRRACLTGPYSHFFRRNHQSRPPARTSITPMVNSTDQAPWWASGSPSTFCP
jgi:hypothetical protein